MNKFLYTALLSSLLVIPTLYSGERSSSHYEMPTDSLDSGGAVSTVGTYSHSGSLGGITGISTVSSPVQTAKAGYLGQLYEVVALEVSGAASVNETASTQLSVAQVLDDDSKLSIPASDATWSVDQGPLTGVNSSGLATTDKVYANTVATAQADYAGLSDTFNLNVLDTVADNYGTYSSDGLGDDWQVEYFGEDNPLAAPTKDPDGDGQDNQFEYIAGLIPNDPASKFAITITPVADESTQMEVKFGPIVEGRSYVVKANIDLTDDAWHTLTSSSVNTVDVERIVTDLMVDGAMKFYRVEVTGP